MYNLKKYGGQQIYFQKYVDLHIYRRYNMFINKIEVSKMKKKPNPNSSVPEVIKDVISEFHDLNKDQKNLTLGYVLGIMGRTYLSEKELPIQKEAG